MNVGQSAQLFEDPLQPGKPERRKRGAPKASPEDEFAFQLEQAQLPKFERKVRFALSIGRKWEFDFACREYMLAVEVEGLVVMRQWVAKLDGPPVPVRGRIVNVTSVESQLSVLGRHASITGFREDAIKYASAAMLGWTVLRFEQKQVTDKDRDALAYTQRVLIARGWRRTD